MEVFLVFVAVGLGIWLIAHGQRLADLERKLIQVIDEVQRQRDSLANRQASSDEPETPLSNAEPVAISSKNRAFSAISPLARPPQAIAVAAAAPPDPLPAPTAIARDEDQPGRAIPSRTSFEDLFGSKLPIWAGGITLAVAGVFIVKYAIDTGLITPLVRVILAYLFSALLLAGGEIARRWSATAIDPRVAQALAGAGLASAYAATLVAENLYHLFGPATAFVVLAAITAAALGLAFRFGSPSAVLGLVGGLAAPALVGGRGNVAILATYLSLTMLGLAGVARYQRWWWLAALALVGGFGWGAVMLVMQALQGAAALPIGLYLLLLAFAVPFVAGRDARGVVRLIPPIVAAMQIAILIVQGGFAPLTWGLYALLSVAVVVLARIDEGQRWLPSMAMVVGVTTIAFWPHPPFAMLAAILLGGGALFAGDAAARMRGGEVRDSGQFGATLLLGFAIGYAKLPGMDTQRWAIIAALLAVPALALAASIWRDPRRDDGRFAVLVTTALILIDVMLWLAIDRSWRCVGMVAVATAAMALAHQARDRALAVAARIALAAGLMALLVVPDLLHELLRVAGWNGPQHWAASARWALVAAGTAVFAWREADRPSGRTIEVIAALLAFTALAQIASGMLERAALTTALFAAGAGAWRVDRLAFARWFAVVLSILALARTLWFDLGVSNPLWTAQNVGALPVFNLLAPAYLLPLLWLALAARRDPAGARRLATLWTVLQIILALTFAATTARQLFHGDVLIGPVGQEEDTVRTIIAIALGVGFLLWGIRVRVRMWRFASLALMLGAVIKVFLFDALGLDGLLRIGAFVALGFSLIGIGWLYSRYLARDDLPGAGGMGIGTA